MEHCDWGGKCNNKAFAEVYPMDKNGRLDRDAGWSYLCYKHAMIAILRGDLIMVYIVDEDIGQLKKKLFIWLYTIASHLYYTEYDYSDDEYVELK